MRQLNHKFGAGYWWGVLLVPGLLLCATDVRSLPTPEAIAGCRTDVPLPKAGRLTPVDRLTLAAPPDGAYIGLYSIGSIVEDNRNFLVRTGHAPAVVFTFHDWVSDDDWASSHPHFRTFTDPLESSAISPLQLADKVRKDGGVLAVAWALQCCDWGSRLFWYGFRKPTVTVARLLRGDFDQYIRTVAHQVKAYQHPIMLTLFSEFNYQGKMSFGKGGGDRLDDADHLCRLYGDPTWPDGPERIRDAFIHVIELFRDEDVRNVTWFMYAGSHYTNPRHEDSNPWLHPKYFYPGDEYIDWVGQSVYFVDPDVAQNIRQQDLATSITEALEPGYEAWGSVTQRPLFLPEFGVLGDGLSSRAHIIEQVFGQVLPRFVRIKAVTLAEFKIAEEFYEVPRLGTFEDEITAWSRAVRENSYYITRAVFKIME